MANALKMDALLYKFQTLKLVLHFDYVIDMPKTNMMKYKEILSNVGNSTFVIILNRDKRTEPCNTQLFNSTSLLALCDTISTGFFLIQS